MAIEVENNSTLVTNLRDGSTALVTRGGSGFLTGYVTDDTTGETSPLPSAQDRITDDAAVRLYGLDCQLSHALEEESTPDSSSVVVRAELVCRNTGSNARSIRLGLCTSAQPSPATGNQRVAVPLSAAAIMFHPTILEMIDPQARYAAVQDVGAFGDFVAHYLEPHASDPPRFTTQLPLLAPVIDVFQPDIPRRVCMFGMPDIPVRFRYLHTDKGLHAWTMDTVLRIDPGEETRFVGYVAVHHGTTEDGWGLCQKYTTTGTNDVPSWLFDVPTHYYDFLSPGLMQATRGRGFLDDAEHFERFRVGLATQHGYYPNWGDYIHPERTEYLAMPGDAGGGYNMSLDQIRERIALARRKGARAAIYIHLAGLDTASPVYGRLRNSLRVSADATEMSINWDGPDIKAPAVSMSIAALEWREHLLQQVTWIMELLDPDAIVVDETFSGVGYDFHPDRRHGQRPAYLSQYAIPFFQALRERVHSFGPDKALITSDCSFSPFVIWADAEGGDNAYGDLLAGDGFLTPPIPYMAPLGRKPWIPCSWQPQRYYREQLRLREMTGAAIGLGNGWIEYGGLAGLPDPIAQKIIDAVSND